MRFDSEAINELKGWEFDLTDARDAYKFDDVKKRIGEYVGRVYGKDMKRLVVSNTEATITKPVYPSGNTATDESKAVWSKEYDQYMKQTNKYEEDKAKVFVIVIGRCTKAMKNRIEKLDTFEEMELKNDVIKLVAAIKQQIFDANERKYSSLRMVLAWKKLTYCRQFDNEDLIDYYKRFVGMIEMVELSFGTIKPNDDDDEERTKFIAMMFMDGVDKKQYGSLLKDLETDHSLGKTDVYPTTLESALQVLILFSEKKLKKTAVTLVQEERKCWECGSTAHVKADCPQWKEKQSKKGTSTTTGTNVAQIHVNDEGAKYVILPGGAKAYLPNDTMM